MADLRADEAQALKYFLLSHAGRRALETFCQAQYGFYSGKCTDHMVGQKQNIAEARQHAHFALCYSTLMAELENFAENQLRTAGQ